ncbi:hypothetical protein HYV12_01745 [Candidatus Dojkabacteria bacterium]|nr:hypothetical protein [Candidatus Dojkabacteria bacterium]
MQKISDFCKDSEDLRIKNLVFEGVYLSFPGYEPPENREAAIERLRDMGFTQGTQTYVAGAILDDKVGELMPHAKIILQVGENQFCGYAHVVYPLQAESDKRGMVAKTYAGCEFQKDVFMILEE